MSSPPRKAKADPSQHLQCTIPVKGGKADCAPSNLYRGQATEGAGGKGEGRGGRDQCVGPSPPLGPLSGEGDLAALHALDPLGEEGLVALVPIGEGEHLDRSLRTQRAEVRIDG